MTSSLTMAKEGLAWRSGLEDSLANLHGLLVVMPEEVIGLIGLDCLPPIHHIPGYLALGERSHHCDYLGREDLF